MRRTAYLAVFAVLALAAAYLTLRAQHTVTVVVASHDLRAGVAIQAEDVEAQRMHDDGVPAGALTNPALAVGEYVAWPVAAGEPVLARMVHAQRSGGIVTAGLTVPDGYRAIAIPVQPAAAVGGMLSPGDRVDVYATPLPGHQTADASAPPSASTTADTSVLGNDLLVLQLRSDQGQTLDPQGTDSVHGLNFGSGKLGSVVVAVAADDVTRYAAAVASDTLYLALSVG